MDQLLLRTFNPLRIFFRSRKGYVHPGGIRYPGGILYYPRHPDEKEPEITPSKLFRVERIAKVKHTPGRQRRILEILAIHEKNRVAIVKNIPEINAMLWKIKHLVRIVPITFPYGEPTEEDINYTVVKENGECLVTKKILPAHGQIEALDKYDTDKKKMDKDTIEKDSRYKWNNAFNGGF